MACQRKTLVLLPGLDGTGRLYAPLQSALEPNFVVGYPPDQPLDYEALCSFVIDRLPGKPHVIVAESFSGPIALEVASRRPSELKALVLSATFATHPRPRLTRFLSRYIESRFFNRSIPLWMIRASLLGPDAPGDLCRNVQETVESVDPAVIAFRMREVAKCDATAALRGCPLPVFYLNGTKDRLLSGRLVRVLSEMKPDMTIMDVAGPHLLLQAKPETCARQIAMAVNSLDWCGN
jgi:pimeloyl-ACP methyl ester carboxylesterase